MDAVAAGDGDSAVGDPSGPARDPRPRRFGRRWAVVGGASVLAAVVGLALAVQSAATPACAAALAAPPIGGTVHQGKATFYDSRGEGGNCSYPGAPADRRYVALGPSEYTAGAACGGYLDVTGPKGTVRVLIMDQCPECEPGHIDLSKEAFAKIADPVQGIVPVSYRAVVNPRLPGPLTFRMKDGASQWWFAVQVGNHGNPLRSVEARPPGGTWHATARQDYNYWLVEQGLGPGPYAIRVTDVYGHRAVATGIRMAPQVIQRSTVYLYGRAAAPAPTRAPAHPRRSTKPTPGTGASPTASAAATPTASPAPVAASGSGVADIAGIATPTTPTAAAPGPAAGGCGAR